MKKLIALSLVTLFVATVHVRAALSREDCVTRVESCEAILREFQAKPVTAIPAQVLQRARALIITNQFRASFFLGIKDGYGVIMVKRPDNSWSLPVLINAGETSLGLQFGGTAVETVYVITDDQTPRLIFSDRFNVGVDAKAVAGPKFAEIERTNSELLNTPVLVYTKSKGLYAGASVKAGFIQRNDKANHLLYSTGSSMPEILYSDWLQPVPEVVPLLDFVRQIAP